LRAPEPFRFPPIGPGWSPRWIAVSIVVHVVVIALWVTAKPTPPSVYSGSRPILLMDIPARASEPARARPVPAAPRGPGPMRQLAVGPGIVPSDLSLPPPLAPSGGGTDSARGRGPGGRGRLTLADAVPQYGDGTLWVRPLWLGPEGSGRTIRMDSVIAVRMLALADSVERFPPADPNADPYVARPWTFRRNGKTYGIDAAGLHLGDFTIPMPALMLLAAQVMPQGNVDQQRANARLMGMRADMLRAAARAQAEEDFRQAVRDIRARRQKERDEQRARDEARARLTP
jgi:hypothetical protein